MEDLVKDQLFKGIYENRNVLITGISGFKGSWLAYWLRAMGARVSGIGLAPASNPSHYELLSPTLPLEILDIRKEDLLQVFLKKTKPEMIFHLAAQALVSESYESPVDTYATNVMGTMHVLNTCKSCPSVKAVVVVTSDKCYEIRPDNSALNESDMLGGYDPYSSSKACAEILTSSFRRSFFHPDDYPEKHQVLIASARAGNVIGGGDWSKDRLIPDLIRAINTSSPALIRSPHSVRPWQHVLESLSGYLTIGARLYQGDKLAARAWNFGPDRSGNRTVSQVLELARLSWDSCQYSIAETRDFHESKILLLDSSDAQKILHWTPAWSVEDAIGKTINWYREYMINGQILTQKHILEYIASAQQKNIDWAKK